MRNPNRHGSWIIILILYVWSFSLAQTAPEFATRAGQAYRARTRGRRGSCLFDSTGGGPILQRDC